ncbi:MAG: hypothetical protein ACJAQ6_000643 [Arenicella sp.]|jgi:hypothetical protein
MAYKVQDVLRRFSELIIDARGKDARFSRIDAVEILKAIAWYLLVTSSHFQTCIMVQRLS